VASLASVDRLPCMIELGASVAIDVLLTGDDRRLNRGRWNVGFRKRSVDIVRVLLADDWLVVGLETLLRFTRGVGRGVDRIDVFLCEPLSLELRSEDRPARALGMLQDVRGS
jgi:hypothetical protein